MGAYALLIGISRFDDPKLAKLNAPREDVEAFAAVLSDPARGGFDNVSTCIDQDLQTIRKQLAKLLLTGRNPNDMVLLYYSGHGIMTIGQRLFLATGQSSFDQPEADSLSALEMRDWLERSRAGKQVVILDCCHSGAFADGAKGVVQTVSDDTFASDNAEGQYVLTATDALQFAYDANGALHQGVAPAALSRFTGWLVDAIGKGLAAPDSDRITLDAVFDYLSRRARVEAAGMTPRRFVKRNSGEMVIAHNPSALPPKLPEEIVAQLESKDWRARRDAVAQLAALGEQSALRDLVEQVVTDRVSLERDVDVRGAMLKLLRRLGGDNAPSEDKTAPASSVPKPFPMRPETKNGAVPDGNTQEPFWKRPKTLALAAGAGVLSIVVIGGVAIGVRSYQNLAAVATYAQQQDANRLAAERSRLAEAAKQREPDAAKATAAALQSTEAQRDTTSKVKPLNPAQLPAGQSTDQARQAALDKLKAPFHVDKDADALKSQAAKAAEVQQQLALLERTNAATNQIAGSEFRDCADCPSMITVPHGSMMMGSPGSESGRDRDEAPQHQVTFEKNFAVGKFEVTFAEWDACVAAGGCNGYKPPDEGWGRDEHPVVNVNWNDAQAYVAWLRNKTGKAYRLLSEAEWEYAARAQTLSAYYWGAEANSARAKYRASGGTATVGSYEPNSFGLYDMAGNVSEWATDCLNKSYDGAPTDGSAWLSGNCSLRALRGGAWNSSAANLRSANRDWDAVGFRVNRNGFRVARGL
jgi:formylglycine-generating enzyme required for sulfatase activity